jgi:hypothetical protein
MYSFWLTVVTAFVLANLGEIETGKILATLPSVELSDYRFGLGDPYIIFYERENFRGLL